MELLLCRRLCGFKGRNGKRENLGGSRAANKQNCTHTNHKNTLSVEAGYLPKEGRKSIIWLYLS